MKVFKTPMMEIQRLEVENVVRTSGCWEAFYCESCYNDAVVCDNYDCKGLKCSCLTALDW